MKTMFVAVLISLFAVVSAIPMAAQQPTRIPLQDTFTQTLNCDTFQLILTTFLSGTELLFPDRVMIEQSVTTTMTNTATGVTLSGTGHVSAQIDLTTGNFAQHGLAATFDVPGRGKLYVEAGTITFNPTTGEFTNTPAFNKQSLCFLQTP